MGAAVGRVFRVKNFERFQHYKDRKPPWVKLYRDLWLDCDFLDLSPASKLLFIGFTTLASVTNNRIPDKRGWISAQLGVPCADKELKALFDAGFLLVEQVASNLLHENDSQRWVETETEKRREETDIRPTAIAGDAVSDEDLILGWNDLAENYGLAKIVELSGERKRKVRARLSEHPKLDFWNRVFTNIGLSDFLRGTQPSNGHPKWRCNFDWLISKDTVPIKIYEGGYNAQTQERG